jgi:hypothetical protein
MTSFVRRGRRAGSRTGRQFSLEWGDQSQVRIVRVWHAALDHRAAREQAASISGLHLPDDVDSGSPAIAAFQVVWQAEDGSFLHSPVIGSPPFDTDGVAMRHDAETRLETGEIVNGMVVFHTIEQVTGLAVVTQSGPLPVLGTPVGFRRESTLTSERSRIGAELVTGVYGFWEHPVLTGFGVRYTVGGVGPVGPPAGPGGRIVRATDAGTPPALAEPPKAPGETIDRVDHLGAPTPATMIPNGRHRRLDVRRVDLWDDELYVHHLDGAPDVYTFRGRGVDSEAQRLREVYTGDQGTLVVHLATADSWIEFPREPVFVPPVPPTAASPDGPTWDNVFSLDHRVDYLAWIFRGLDISRMEPFDFQAATGVLRQEVFEAPAPGSRDFHVAMNGKATVVPNGWWFMGDVTGGTNARTTSSFSDEESRRTWATSLGISAEAEGAGAKVAYSNNSSAHDALTRASSDKVVSTISEIMEIDHHVVVDLATVELSDGFRRAVAQTAASPTDEALRLLAERFGMFFAYAVTFGSKSWEQRHETEASVADSMTHGTSQNQSVSAGFQAPVGGVSGSVSVGADDERAASTKRGTGSDVSATGSVGSASEPVPILLDIEPLTHLLSPVFFDDPAVYIGLRQRFEAFLDSHPDGSFDTTTSSLDFEIAPRHMARGRNGEQIRVGSTGAPVEYVYNGVRYPTDGAGISGQTGGRAISPEAGDLYSVSDHPINAEGALLRDGASNAWFIRGGYRHRIPEPVDFRLLPPTWRRPHLPAVTDFADSREPFTMEGKLLSVPSVSREVWWISGGKRHLVPTEAVVEVLGGWQVVGGSDGDTTEELLEQFEPSRTPTSVDAKMIRLADGPEVWVIHERQRFRVRNELGIRKRGGWQQVAVVPEEVAHWFPDSGLDAR